MTLFHHCFVVGMCIFWGIGAVNSAMAVDDKTIITAGPSWEGFTNKDGHGLYHDIIGKVIG